MIYLFILYYYYIIIIILLHKNCRISNFTNYYEGYISILKQIMAKYTHFDDVVKIKKKKKKKARIFNLFN